ncbi:MAG: HAD family hydrolase [Alphaproteobacteria bacterium]
MSCLLIFDCDGVLVDSETLSSQVLAGFLTELGYPLSAAESVARFTGMSIAGVRTTIMAEGYDLPADFVDEVHRRADIVFDRDLKPVVGIAEVLARLAGPRCVASSGSPARISRSLRTTGLDRFFATDALFSAAMVARGKPAPDLFLHAAAAMGTDPAHCLVIEDSALGVQAARAAGMPVLGYAGAGHCGPGHADRLHALGAAAVFDDIGRLPGLLEAVNPLAAGGGPVASRAGPVRTDRS